MQTRQFHLGDVLSIITGRTVSIRHIEGVYDILNFMTNDRVLSHQFKRVFNECKPHLLRQHPELGTSEMDEALVALDRNLGEEDKEGHKRVVLDWLTGQVEKYGETLEIAPIPTDAHEVRDPIDEAIEMKGELDKVSVVTN